MFSQSHKHPLMRKFMIAEHWPMTAVWDISNCVFPQRDLSWNDLKMFQKDGKWEWAFSLVDICVRPVNEQLIYRSINYVLLKSCCFMLLSADLSVASHFSALHLFPHIFTLLVGPKNVGEVLTKLLHILLKISCGKTADKDLKPPHYQRHLMSSFA